MKLKFALVAIFASISLTIGRVDAGSNIYVGDASPDGGFTTMDEVDHSVWDGLLKKYVDENGRVNYREWHKNSSDRRQLKQYLRGLSRATAKQPASKSAKLAFWINAYNAVTVEGILRVYPTTSIRNHTAKLFGYNIWDDLQLYVGRTPYSLNQIEHEILRKMAEPRIHFAIVCASKGCPRLKNEAYTIEKIEQQLGENAKHFFAQSVNFRIRGGTVTLSSILDWFGEDFGDDEAAVLRKVSVWLKPEDLARIRGRRSWSVQYSEYDWTLNE